jgi:DNA-directed RNA polymerase subunit RPC12/RpoP
MRCVVCGAEMHLMQVDLADTPMAGFERHIFKCSTCSHISRRLVLSRPRPPVTNLPLVAQHPEPPTSKLQMKRVAAESALAKLSEKLRSKQTALKEHAAVAGRPEPTESDFAAAPTVLNDPAAPSKSAWERAVAKVRARQVKGS